MNAPPFFVVWREGGNVPRFRHNDITSAENEAERLAKANPGEPFFVLMPTAVFCERRVTVERFDVLATEIPF